jgi:nucleoside-diphosphate-sugar epimerase
MENPSRGVTILLTGASGFLGSHIASTLVSQGYRVLALFHSSPVRSDGLEPVRGDILVIDSLKEILKDVRVDAIIHAAAVLLDKTANPRTLVEVNVTGTLNILEAARLHDVKKIVFASSAAVYGNAAGKLVNEDHPVNPNNSYGATKLLAEIYGLEYSFNYGMNFLALRFTNIYGPGRERGPSLHRELIENAVAGIPTRIPHGAKNRIDWVYVKDCSNAVLLSLRSQRIQHRVFNIASGKHKTLLDLKKAIKTVIPDATIDVGPGLYPGLDIRGLMDISRAAGELNYVPQYNLEKGVRDYIDSLREQSKEKSRSAVTRA